VPEASAQDAGNSFPDFFVELSSNPPDIRVIQESEMGLTQIRMTSSNLEPLSGGGLRWFAELRNGSFDSWCNPHVIVRFMDEQGTALWLGEAEVRTMPHFAMSDLEPVLCVAGEDTTVAWAVDLEAPVIDLNDVNAVGLRIGGDAMSDTRLHPATPQLEAEIIEVMSDAGIGYAVAGALRGVSQPVAYTAVAVFAKNGAGYIFDVFGLAKLDPPDGTLEPEELWQFQTPLSPEPIASFRALLSFEP
jgi:hypothetical protein